MPIKKTTEFIRAHVGVQPRPLGKGKIVSVHVQNTFNNMDSSPNNQEIMIGGATGQPHQIIPGQTSEEIFANDLEEVWARVRDQVVEDETVRGTPVDVTLIIHKEVCVK